MNIYELALTNQNPEPAGSAAYIPWWAKGEYARAHGTRWEFPDGTTVHGGQVQTRGHGRAPKAAPVYTPHPAASSAGETPRKPAATPDRARALVMECAGRSERVALCRRWGIDPTILDAPNPGVATMRLLNALRKVVK